MIATLDGEIGIRANYTFRVVDDSEIVRLLWEVYKVSRDEAYFRLKNKEYDEQSLMYLLQKYDLGRVQKHHNLIPNVIRNALATLTSGTAVIPTFIANKVALGTDATLVAVTDETLGNEVIREDFTARSATDNVAYLDKFFASSVVGGNTFQEAGIFVDGANPVNGAGFLLSHVNFNETLTATESLSINCTISYNNG